MMRGDKDSEANSEVNFANQLLGPNLHLLACHPESTDQSHAKTQHIHHMPKPITFLVLCIPRLVHCGHPGSRGNSNCEARKPSSAMPDDTKGKKEIETKDVEMKDAEKKDKDGKGDADKKEKEEPPKSPRTGCNSSRVHRVAQFMTQKHCAATGSVSLCFTLSLLSQCGGDVGTWYW